MNRNGLSQASAFGVASFAGLSLWFQSWSQVDVPLDYSLRQYVSVLYKVPRMQVRHLGASALLRLHDSCADLLLVHVMRNLLHAHMTNPFCTFMFQSRSGPLCKRS